MKKHAYVSGGKREGYTIQLSMAAREEAFDELGTIRIYGYRAAQDLANANSAELGVKTVPSLNIVYTEEKGYVTADVADKEGLTLKKLSGTKFRQMLRGGEDIPEWFAYPSVVKVLQENILAGN